MGPYGSIFVFGESMYTFDFETHPAINEQPLAPLPVGVAIKHNNEPSHYYSWGHPTNNNCTLLEGMNALKAVYASEEPLLCHNSKFDLRVALDYFGLEIPDSSRIHDTMIMAYLINAREVSLGLKDLAVKYCGMDPDARDRLYEWITANVSKTNQGAHIYKAPGDLAGEYAESDTDMTYALFNELAAKVIGVQKSDDYRLQNMGNAYDREQRLMPVIIDMEVRGVTVSDKAGDTLDVLEKEFELLDMQLSAYSGGQKPGSKAMFTALRDRGYIDESKITYTDKGNPRYGKDFIMEIVSDEHLGNVLKRRSKLQKLLGTYVRKFYNSSKVNDGKYFPYYNQTRSDTDYGTRTGRLSSNIQQLPKDTGANTDMFDDNVEGLPSVRSLIVPSSKNKSFIKFDFSGQELRVTAHYAEGKILQAYIDDPSMDVHKFVENLIIEMTGIHLKRTPVKMISFLKLYGGGPNVLSQRLKIDLAVAQGFFQAYDTALPEFKALMKDIEALSRSGKKIKTWGGRYYDVEIKGGRKFYYKLGNVLIQGSSADMTKEAMIRYHYHPDRKGDLVLTVHDELVVEVDDEFIDSEADIVQWAMNDIPGWDVPLKSDGAVGKNLAEMKKYGESQEEE